MDITIHFHYFTVLEGALAPSVPRLGGLPLRTPKWADCFCLTPKGCDLKRFRLRLLFCLALRRKMLRILASRLLLLKALSAEVSGTVLLQITLRLFGFWPHNFAFILHRATNLILPVTQRH